MSIWRTGTAQLVNVQLAGVHCPHWGKSGGREATEQLSRLLVGLKPQKVTVQVLGSSLLGAGAVRGDVYLSDGRIVATELLKSGVCRE